MKKYKFISIILIIISLTVGGLFVYNYYTKQDSNTTLTILEKQWIENNKNKIIDLSIITEVPVLNYEGNGLILDFIRDFERDTSLEFNKVSHTNTEKVETDYSVTVKDKVGKNDILIYQDNYVLVGNNKVKYNNLSDIKNLTIGLLSKDLANIEKYLNSNKTLTYKTYDSVEEMFEGLTNKEIGLIAVPRLMYLNNVLINEFHITYQITEYKQNFVFTLGKTDKLNTIIKKYFKKWNKDNFSNTYYEHLTNDYFDLTQVAEQEKTDFKSKSYVYGFVTEAPYDAIKDGRLEGINSNLLRDFRKMSGIEITFANPYNSNKQLVDAFNKNEIDFFFATNEDTKYKVDTYKTIYNMESEIVVATSLENSVVINCLASLEDSTVLVLKNSKASETLDNYSINKKEYDNINGLVKAAKKDKEAIIVIDKASYNYYVRNDLKTFNIDYTYTISDGYGFLFRNIKDNQVFAKYFDFYMSFIANKNAYTEAYNILLVEPVSVTKIIVSILTFIGGSIVLLFAIFGLYKYLHTGVKKATNVPKGDKIKYIDMLTSLKNRNYLNDNIEKWDESDVYPQTIVIVDLNNVAYINDNYGHQEGDNVIKEAANILIKSQIDNSDIIRTSGNEFLVYLVGHEEKDIVSYIRKLNKEMKTISHGFGVAIGYSMITDAIKSIDDAVNEATLDMRNAKEEINN